MKINNKETKKLKHMFVNLLNTLNCPMCNLKLEQIDIIQMHEVAPINATHGFKCINCPFTIFW